MTSTAIIITVISSILSGLAGALISTIIFVKREKRMFKVQTLKKFAANRYHILGENFTEALNEIFVVFNDSSKVMEELQNFHQVITANHQSSGPANDALVRLYKAMCDETKTEYGYFNDSFFLKPFNVRNGKIQSRQN